MHPNLTAPDLLLTIGSEIEGHEQTNEGMQPILQLP